MKTILICVFLLCASLSFGQRNEKEAKAFAKYLYIVLSNNPDKFCEMSRTFNEDPVTKTGCGLYDFDIAEKYVLPVRKVILKEKNLNKIQKPVKSIHGYHVILPLGIKEDKVKFRHILIKIAEN